MKKNKVTMMIGIIVLVLIIGIWYMNESSNQTEISASSFEKTSDEKMNYERKDNEMQNADDAISSDEKNESPIDIVDGESENIPLNEKSDTPVEPATDSADGPDSSNELPLDKIN